MVRSYCDSCGMWGSMVEVYPEGDVPVVVIKGIGHLVGYLCPRCVEERRITKMCAVPLFDPSPDAPEPGECDGCGAWGSVVEVHPVGDEDVVVIKGVEYEAGRLCSICEARYWAGRRVRAWRAEAAKNAASL